MGIAPDGNGEFDPRVTKTLKEIGSWMKTNGEAVYGTKPVAPYADGNFRFTQKGNAVYAFYLVRKIIFNYHKIYNSLSQRSLRRFLF